jgi:hypothetical protein
MCVEFRIFGIPFVEVISDQKMNVSFETTLVLTEDNSEEKKDGI